MLSRLLEPADDSAAITSGRPGGTSGFCPFNLLRKLLKRLFAEVVGGFEGVSFIADRVFSATLSGLRPPSSYAIELRNKSVPS